MGRFLVEYHNKKTKIDYNNGMWEHERNIIKELKDITYESAPAEETKLNIFERCFLWLDFNFFSRFRN